MRTLSPEHRAKISASLIGNQRGLGHRYSRSAEDRVEISARMRGNKNSLGRTRPDVSARMRGNQYARTHGHARHGGQTAEYKAWSSMLARCYNPKDASFADYGGRGITVCERWRESFQAFLDAMGERPPGLTLDRKNNDLGYFKANCRWATWSEQNKNQRPRRRKA